MNQTGESKQTGVFASEQNVTSRRWAVFEDNEVCAYLYLTEPDSQKPVGDCWIYNRIPAPEPSKIKEYRPQPPPVARGYVGPQAQQSPPREEQVSFRWSSDGNAVAVLIDGRPMGVVVIGGKNFSWHLVKSGPWGEPWDDDRFVRTFGQP
jgi:hypothetical protein